MERQPLIGRPSLLFIGMPSSGKTTAGGLASRLLDMPFVDIDTEIERRCGMTVAEIFSRFGEEHFRRQELLMARELSGRGGTVISPGGGIVENPLCMELLSKNAIICRLRRDPALIDTTGRPLLSRPGAIEELLRRRGPLYDKYADFTVDNDSTPEECAHRAAAGYLELAR